MPGGGIGDVAGAFMILSVSPEKALLFLIFILLLQQKEAKLAKKAEKKAQSEGG